MMNLVSLKFFDFGFENSHFTFTSFKFPITSAK